MQMIRDSPGPTLPKRGKRMTYMAMAQATAWPRVKNNQSLMLILPIVCTIPESRIFKGLSPRVTWFEGSETLMAYQNFFAKKYHWMVKASMMKLRTRPLMENYLRYTDRRPKPK